MRYYIKREKHWIIIIFSFSFHLPGGQIHDFLLVKAMVFPVVMYGYESWTIKKTEHWRIYAFELRCWRRLLTIPWTARRLNQSILKEISPEYWLEGLMLKLKLQYFGHLMRSRRRRGRQSMRGLDGITDSTDMNLSRLWELVWTGKPGVLQS